MRGSQRRDGAAGQGCAPASRRILVVDDEPSIAELLRDMLSRRGFDVDTSLGGEDALARAVAGDYGLVISDFAIPGLNGLDFVRRFGAARSDGRVLIISAFLDPEVVEALEDQPAVVGLVRKPFDLFDLLRRVEKVFADRHVPPETLQSTSER